MGHRINRITKHHIICKKHLQLLLFLYSVLGTFVPTRGEERIGRGADKRAIERPSHLHASQSASAESVCARTYVPIGIGIGVGIGSGIGLGIGISYWHARID
jgi:hypothetical protein